MQGNYRISNPLQFGLLGGLGFLIATVIGNGIQTLASVITYVAAAIFIALGLQPIITKLTKLGLHRNLAIVTVILLILTVLTFIIAAVLPPLISQTDTFIKTAPQLLDNIKQIPLVVQLDTQFNGAISNAIAGISNFLADSKNWPLMFDGIVKVGLSLFNGLFGVLIVGILSLYFMASMESFKTWIYSMVAVSKREKFIDLSEEMATSVGRYVISQVSIGVIQAIFVFTLLSIMQVPYAIVISSIAFILGLIPLIGTITAATIASLVALSVSPTTAIIVAVIYLIYMQVEANLLSPKIMSRAVKVPGAVVVVAALAGGALLGILGALVAIPAAASIMLIIRKVLVPYQEQR